MLKIIWSSRADDTFETILLQIESKWGLETAADFHGSVQDKLKLIAINPFLFKESAIKDVRHALISKQTSMLYEVHPNHILVLFFFDNRQEPLL